MNIPAELKYTKDHEWVRQEGDLAVVGITDFAQSELGDIVFVDIQTEGETLAKEEVLSRLSRRSRTLSCRFPAKWWKSIPPWKVLLNS